MRGVARAIDAESEAIIWRTFAAGTYDSKGYGVPGAATDVAKRAAIQPITGRQLLDLPLGVREDVEMLGWTRAPVAVDDHIRYRDEWFRVFYARPRPMDGFTRIALGRISP